MRFRPLEASSGTLLPALLWPALLWSALLWLALPVTPARAQFTRFENYTDAQGLGDLTVTALAQDADGYMLLGTESGLFRFDGAGIAPYGLSAGLSAGAWIGELLPDRAGRLWVLTPEGIFVRLAGRFRRVETGQATLDPEATHQFAASGGEAFLALRGRLLEASVSDAGVGPFHPAAEEAALRAAAGSGQVHFVVADAQGGVLVGCGGAVCRVAGGQVTVMGTGSGLPADDWQVALRTPDGTLWARSLGRLAWRRPGEASFRAVAVPGEHRSFFAGVPDMLALVPDQQAGVVTQGDEGILRWDGGAWRVFLPHEGGLPPSVVEALAVDRDGALWVGSSGYGAFRSQGRGLWEHWTTQDGLPANNVWSLDASATGRLWAATANGTVPLLGSAGSVVAGSDYALVRSRQGRLWLAPLGAKLARVDAISGRTERFDAIGIVRSAAVDKDDRLWLCTRTALYVIDDADAPQARVHARFVLSGGRMSVASDSSGAVWLLSRQGVFREGEGGRFELLIPGALLSGQPDAVSFAPGAELWVGTEQNGIMRFRIEGRRARQLTPIGTPQISSNAIMFLYRDHRDWVWVGTDHGINVLDGLRWRSFDSSDGVISNDVDEASVAEDGDGSMWFGTSHGLSHLIDPPRLPPETRLHPRVERATLGGHVLDPAGLNHVAWSDLPLVIDLADADYGMGRVGFRYRMLGLDSGWTETTGRQARYTHLPAGSLRFELVAFNANPAAISAPVSFGLEIDPPWWRRWWFYVSCAVAGALVLLAASRVRLRLLLEHKQWLEALVTARTAEIEEARAELQLRARQERERLADEQLRLEEMVRVRTVEIEQARHELERLAMSDALTGLANRRAIIERLEAMMAEALASRSGLGVLLCDLDLFKTINDGFGHLAGDMVLSSFGARLGSTMDRREAAGRYGGEEFLVILPGPPDAVRRRVTELRASLSGFAVEFGGAWRRVTSSGGLAFLREGDTVANLVGRADEAMYRAKNGGRNRIEEEEAATQAPGASASIELPDRTRAAPCDRRSSELEEELRLGFAQGQFSLEYQPVVNFIEEAVTSCEALLRWRSPALGVVSPGLFIPVAERIGLMPALGEWVLRTACREAASWPEAVRLSVNLSPLQLRHPDLADRVAAALAEAGLEAGRLELEVTETAMIEDVAGATAMLTALRGLGVTIALDDFGTGASSLSFLRTLPFDRLKIDRSFVQDLGVRPEAFAIVRAMAELCGSLRRGITGEGAETERQITMLREAGCAEIQGFGIGRPVPPEELRVWLAGYGARVEAARGGVAALAG